MSLAFSCGVAGGLLRCLDDPVGDPRLVEGLFPVRKRLAGECPLEDLGQRARVLGHRVRIGEARILEQAGLADHVREPGPVRRRRGKNQSASLYGFRFLPGERRILF
jgi:hypothetical protein